MWQKEEKEWLGVSFKPENFIPGLVIGFIFGMLFDLAKQTQVSNTAKRSNLLSQSQRLSSTDMDEELKMVPIFFYVFIFPVLNDINNV